MLRRILITSLLVGATLLGLTGAAYADPPGGWGPVIACESGNRNIMNRVDPAHSTAQGFFQITNGTWKDNGGRKFAPTAMGASFAEQKLVANTIFARRGLAPWGPSAKCRSHHRR